jgi:hypothetical protein
MESAEGYMQAADLFISTGNSQFFPFGTGGKNSAVPLIFLI